MERVTIRLKNTGPIGYVRAVTPITLHALRQLMIEQLSASLPGTGFRFLAGGMPVSLVQEADEDYQEGDVQIVPLPAGVAADTDAAGAASGTPSKGLAAELPPKPPAVSLVSQWVDAFAFMSPDEQMEAIGLLRLRYPSAALLVGETRGGNGAVTQQSSTPGSRRVHSTPSSSGRGGGRMATPPQAQLEAPRPQSQSRKMPPWSPASVGKSGGELRPAPLDDRIAQLYYGRGRSGKALSYGAGERSHRSKSTPPSSKTLRRMHELHETATVASVIRAQEAPHPIEGGGFFFEGSANAATNNCFASSLRSSCAPAAAPTAEMLRAAADSTPRGGSGSTPRRLSRSASGDSATEMFGEGVAPSSLARSDSARSVGSHESPSKSVAFGSGRPQRPEASVQGHSACLPTTSRLLGVY